MIDPEIARKVKGYLWGAACGDALGMPVEFLSLPEIRNVYGKQGIEEPVEDALWTDDTQMIIYLAKALIKGAEKDTSELMDLIAQEFINWLDNPGIAPGNTCVYSVMNLLEGIHWTSSGLSYSKGCGSVMRSGIIGIFYHNDTNKLLEVSRISSTITHQHLSAQASSVAGSYAVKLAMDDVSPEFMLEPLIAATQSIYPEFEDILKKAYVLASSRITDVAGLRRLGEGWIAEEAFAMAYFCILRYPDDYKKAMQTAVNITGDSDSVACIAGGILGTFLGVEAIPEEWINKLEEKDHMQNIIDRALEKLSSLDRFV